MSKPGGGPPTREELQGMKRTDLQQLAKDHNIKANLKTEALRDALIDELVENQPEPKTADSSLGSSSNTSPARPHPPPPARKPLAKDVPAKPTAAPGRSNIGAGKPKLVGRGAAAAAAVATAGASGSRKPAGAAGRGLIVPPGVVAANPKPDPKDPKGKGRVKKSGPGLGAPPKATIGSKLPVAKTTSMDSVRTEIAPIAKSASMDSVRTEIGFAKTASMESVRTDLGDHDTDVAMNFSSDLSPPLRNASHSDSISLAALSARIKKLEHAREASRERREKEMEMLQNQLKAAQESIGVLAKQNDALKAQVEMAPKAATPKDVSDVLSRVIVLEDLFRKMKFGKAVSDTSDEMPYGDISYAPPVVQNRSDYQTPPNRPGSERRRMAVLAPAANIMVSHGVEPPRTPPPHIRRYSTNPDESPSPTRLPSNTGRILARPPAETVPTAGSSPVFGPGRRRTSAVREGEALLESKGAMDPPKRGRLSGTMELGREYEDESDGLENNNPLEPGRRNASDDESCDEFGGDEKAPLGALPHPIIDPALAAAIASPFHLGGGDASSSRSQRRSSRGGRSSRGNVRSAPYMKRDVPRGYSSSPGADTESHEEPMNPRDIFGATPGSGRVPPNPFADGPLPVLTFGRPSLTHSIVETPAPSPSRTLALPVEETPPPSRTRFGTEFGTTMKNRFSD